MYDKMVYSFTSLKGLVMKRIMFLQAVLMLLLGLISSTASAWERSLELGYANSHDPNHSRYRNSGVMLSGDFFPLYHSPWTYLSLNAAVGQWWTNAPTNQNLTTGSVGFGLRLYPFTIANIYPVYALGTANGAVLSHRQFGQNKQGSNLTFQVGVGAGIELNQFDINLRWAHFSNAHLAHPDNGYNFLYLLSVGYLFC